MATTEELLKQLMPRLHKTTWGKCIWRIYLHLIYLVENYGKMWSDFPDFNNNLLTLKVCYKVNVQVANVVTHHCILLLGHCPLAPQLSGLVHDAQDTAALQCHKSAGTTPLALLRNNREAEGDNGPVPVGLRSILACVVAQVQRTVCFIILRR